MTPANQVKPPRPILRFRQWGKGFNELTSASRSGTLTVAGTTGQRKATFEWDSYGVTKVTVSGTGLASGNAEAYSDGYWAMTGATPDEAYQRKSRQVSVFCPMPQLLPFGDRGTQRQPGCREDLVADICTIRLKKRQPTNRTGKPMNDDQNHAFLRSAPAGESE